MRLVILGCLMLALQTAGFCLKDPICGQEPGINGDGFIRCIGQIFMFSYNPRNQSCEMFIYGGCFGNDNRFKTLEECEEKCKLDTDSDYCPYE